MKENWFRIISEQSKLTLWFLMLMSGRAYLRKRAELGCWFAEYILFFPLVIKDLIEIL